MYFQVLYSFHLLILQWKYARHRQISMELSDSAYSRSFQNKKSLKLFIFVIDVYSKERMATVIKEKHSDVDKYDNHRTTLKRCSQRRRRKTLRLVLRLHIDIHQWNHSRSARLTEFRNNRSPTNNQSQTATQCLTKNGTCQCVQVEGKL